MAVGFHRTIRTFRTSRTYNPIESEKEGKITEGTDQYILKVQGDVLLEEQEDIFMEEQEDIFEIRQIYLFSSTVWL